MLSLSITAKQLQKILRAQEKPNGQAKKTWCLSKHPHGSKMEAADCNWFFARRQHREIEDFKWQISVRIPWRGKRWRDWKIDFEVRELGGELTYWETKGRNLSDDSFKLKRDAFCLAYPKKKLYVNRQRYTIEGRKNAVRASTRWRMKDLRRIAKARREGPRRAAGPARRGPGGNF